MFVFNLFWPNAATLFLFTNFNFDLDSVPQRTQFHVKLMLPFSNQHGGRKRRRGSSETRQKLETAGAEKLGSRRSCFLPPSPPPPPPLLSLPHATMNPPDDSLDRSRARRLTFDCRSQSKHKEQSSCCSLSKCGCELFDCIEVRVRKNDAVSKISSVEAN